MELESLKVLLVVAEQGSFSSTAAKLGLAQSAVSRQIQRLECELDTRLFYRNGRGVQLTESGEKLQRFSKEIFDAMDRLKEDLSTDSSKLTGVVTLGLPPSLGATISTGLVRRFRKQYPTARLRVVVAFSGALTDWLEAGQIDVGVLYDVRRSATLLVTPLLLEPLHLVESGSTDTGSNNVSLSELGIGPFVIPCSANGMRRIVDEAAVRSNIQMKITAEIDSLDAIRELVEAGPERAVLPMGAVYRQVQAGLLTCRRFDDPHMQALLVLATPLRQPVGKLASAVQQLAQEEVSRCVAEGKLRGLTGSNLRDILADKASARVENSKRSRGVTDTDS